MNKEPSPPSAPDDPEIWEAIARHLAGESTPEEAGRVRAWLELGPGRREMVSALEAAVARYSATREVDVDVEAALSRVKARFADASVHELSAARSLRREHFNRRWRSTLVRVAAAVIVVLGVSVIWRAAQDGPGTVTTIAAQTFNTGIGEVDSVLLRDGTRVVLAPGSRLVLSEGYGTLARDVSLNGEAWFDVQHDTGRPFRVRAGSATILDLGTAFAVRSVEGGGVKVSVMAGSVMLRPSSGQESKGVVLRAGDRGAIDEAGNVSAERSAATAEDVAFRSGRLVFHDATLHEVRAQLRRWYGVELQLSDAKLAQRHLTASFNGESIEQVLNVIGLAFGASIERNGDTAIIRSPN